MSHEQPAPPDGSATYRERLAVPLSWWLSAPGMGLVVVIALIVTGLPLVVVLGSGLVTAAATCWLLARYGAQVEVSGAGLAAGRALLPWWACGSVRPLDAAEARTAFGVDADARAFLVLRSYCRGAVRVEVDDAADPTPYWLVSTRHADQLASACESARSATQG